MAAWQSAEWRVFRLTALCFAVAAVALALIGLGDATDDRSTRALSNGALVVFSLWAAISCGHAATSRPPERRMPWLLLTVAAGSYAVGNMIWFYYQQLAPASQTFPGPADVFYVGLVPFVVAGMLILPSRRLSGAARARAVADGLIMAAALLFVSWIVVVGPLFDQLGEADPLYLFVYLYYPLADILIISIASTLAVRAAGRERLPLLLVAAAFAAIACADTGIGYLALQGEEAAGSGFDVGWTVGYMLLALAAIAPVSPAAREDAAADPRALIRELLPYLPVTGVLLLIATSPDRLTDQALDSILVIMVTLLVARHLLTLADNIGLTRGLERRVQARTHELERLTSQQQSILNGAGEGIIGLDRSGRITFANPVAGEIVDLATEELTGADHAEVLRLHDGDGSPIPQQADPVGAALAEGTVRTLTDGVHRRRDGSDTPIELTVTPIRDADEVAGAVVLVRDVTERRLLDKMKNEFVSVVSHELRTPLTSVRGALGLLQGGLLADAPPKAQRMIGIAVESTDRLIRLINDILDVERIASGNVAADRRECTAADLVGRAVAEMRGLADEAGVRIERGVSTGRLHADPDRIVQALTNLLSNAIKFSPTGGVVRVSAEEHPGAVLFTVSDQGRGIPADQLETVFGRFSQVDSADTRDKGGTGLGLAICRGIVELHGGRIWAESEVGQGAVFHFTLPAAPADSREGPAGRTGSTVLLWHHDARTRAAMRLLLEDHGYRVSVARPSEQTASLAAVQAPLAVVTDLGSPGADGWSAIRALRDDERTREVPVVIVGGHGAAAPPVDVTAWLSEPLDVTALLTTLDRAVRGVDDRPRVLLVEDDQALGQVMSALFDRHGIQVRLAESGYRAIQLSQNFAPDLILLDLLLPDVDGFAVARFLHAGPHLRSVPLVVYSALDLDEEDRRRLGVGPDECFTKATTSPEEVERRVLDLLHQVIVGAGR